VVRDLRHGKRTYGELADSPEGIPTNFLADRL
jgi:DNA-binding HxlR family transcriptional regulator